MLGQAAIVALGLGVLIQRSDSAFAVVRLIGVCYLVYLGLQAILRSQPFSPAFPRHQTTRRYIWQGFVVGLTNPKATLFLVATLPQFVNRAHGSATEQMLVLGTVFALLCFLTAIVYGALSGGIGSWLSRSVGRARGLSVLSGVAIIGLAVRLALTGRRD